MSSGMVTFVLVTATVVVDDGISPSMEQSAQLQQPLKAWSTWYKEQAGKKILTVCDKLKESVRKAKRALCAWDSGSVNVLVLNQVMPTPAGIQCPGSTWKKYLLHRLEKSRFLI